MTDVKTRFTSAQEDVKFVIAAFADRGRWRNRHWQVGGTYCTPNRTSSQRTVD